MKNNEYQMMVARTAGTVLMLVFLSVALYFGLGRIDRYLDLKARQDCAAATRYEKVDEATKTTVSYPVTDLYKQCLKEKHLLP